MDSPAILVLLGVDFATDDEPCSQYKHFDFVVLVAAVHPSKSSRWIVAAAALDVTEIAAAKVVMEAYIEFLLWVMVTLSTCRAWNQFFQKHPR